MIRLTTNAKSTSDFFKKLKTNIMRSQTKLAERFGRETKQAVELEAPEWRGTLAKKVVMKVFPKSHRAEVFMASPHYDMVARQNEFNPRGRRKLYKTSYPKLADWADSKGIFLGKPFVIIGGMGTRMGRQNRFFGPAFQRIQTRVPQIASEVIANAIMKIRV